jgi:hypothetical protein
MARSLTLVVLATCCGSALCAPPKVTQGGTPLAAASCGMRQTLWIEHYSAVLYLPKRAPAQEELVSPLAPKLLEMKIIDPRFLPRDIPRKWREPIQKHLDAAASERATAAYRSLLAGDRLTLAYTAEQGVTLRINERVVAQSTGHGLVDAILATWADDEPMREKLRRVIARNACRPDQLAAISSPGLRR